MNFLAEAMRLVAATLREIFDESAYARFLKRSHMTSSPAAYAAFWRERESSRAPRIKCC